MIQEDYITFEQAKALKELGFPQWYGNTSWPYYDGYSFDGKETSVISSNCKMEYSKVPLSLVQKWLREERNLHIDVTVVSKDCYMVGINSIKQWWDDKFYATEIFRVSDYISYEEALSAGIDKCIEILKEK